MRSAAAPPRSKGKLSSVAGSCTGLCWVAAVEQPLLWGFGMPENTCRDEGTLISSVFLPVLCVLLSVVTRYCEV